MKIDENLNENFYLSFKNGDVVDPVKSAKANKNLVSKLSNKNKSIGFY